MTEVLPAQTLDQRVVVTGGRDYNDVTTLWTVLDSLSIVELGHGNATGADTLADEWARARGVPCTAYPANWRAHGKGAGPRRNRAMLDEFRPDLVVAFPGGAGTKHMVDLAIRLGYRVFLADPPVDADVQPPIWDA